ncbi:MAG: hypothetical protein IPG53_07520 [Ignavibacteriales bacterium]|nr:hypothetical protein [Ignavibacteriales bacterium]
MIFVAKMSTSTLFIPSAGFDIRSQNVHPQYPNTLCAGLNILSTLQASCYSHIPLY